MNEITEQAAGMKVKLPHIPIPANLLNAKLTAAWDASNLASSSLPEGFVFAAWNPTTGETLVLDSGSWVAPRSA